MENKSLSKNILSIDLLRACAALGVFYYHSHLGAIIAKYSGLSFFILTDIFGAVYAVPLFFLISGYCIHISNLKYIKTNSILPLKQYYAKRFLRIYPPYLVALLFAIVVNFITIENYTIDSPDLLIHLFSLQGFTTAYFNTINVVLWTISIELAFYVIYPVFYYIRFKYNLNYALLLTLVVTCLSILFFYYKGDVTLPQRFFVLNLWFAWCCGAYLADKNILDPGTLKQSKYLIFYAVVLTAFIYLKYSPSNLVIIADQLNILIWTAPIMVVLSQESWIKERENTWVIKILSAIGVSSYSLYLFHEPLISLKNFLAHQYLAGRLQPIGVMAGVLIIPVVTWYSFKYIEKPFMLKKRKVNDGSKPSVLLNIDNQIK